MSDSIQVFMTAFFALSCAALILYLIADGVQFSRALRLARKNGRLSEWFEQPHRFMPGSGFRLFRHFRRP